MRKHIKMFNSIASMTPHDTAKRRGCHCKNPHKQRMKSLSMTPYTLYKKLENKKEGIHAGYGCGFLRTATGGMGDGGVMVSLAEPAHKKPRHLAVPGTTKERKKPHQQHSRSADGLSIKTAGSKKMKKNEKTSCNLYGYPVWCIY